MAAMASEYVLRFLCGCMGRRIADCTLWREHCAGQAFAAKIGVINPAACEHARARTITQHTLTQSEAASRRKVGQLSTQPPTQNARYARFRNYALLRRLAPKVREDLGATYTRHLHKWLIIAPLVGIAAGLLITLVAVATLHKLWPRVFAFYLHHHWAIVPCMTVSFALIGWLMQKFTADPNEHSTEEVIQSYHEHNGDMDLRSMPVKLLASVMTVGLGGSSALEGPSIYGGAAIGSWLWARLRAVRRLGLNDRDRRIMLICGAAAGMSAVFRAPLTGVVFALEMPYKDDLAHEALLPSLIASVVSYFTLGALVSSEPLFNFAAQGMYTMHDLLWCALLGAVIALISMTFVISFRRLRRFVVRQPGEHWMKVAVGGFLTGLCGLLFLQIYPGTLMPIGPNYEAVEQILRETHTSAQLAVFAALKLVATAFTLGAGGVGAMFVPMFLTGGAVGIIFSQTVVHSTFVGLYAVVGMASFIAAAYKAPLAAVVFVAEVTGGHAYLIPALVGSAVAYAISGDASISSDQRIHASDEPTAAEEMEQVHEDGAISAT